jgi:dehydrogenase/reductase SDR family protein 7B
MENKTKLVCLITGGSSGIGRACAEVFGKAGYAIVISGRNKETLENTCIELRSKQIDITGVPADAASEADAALLVDKTIATYGQLDVLINNAGISMRALFQDTDVSVIREVMNINFWGMVYVTKAAMPHILKSKGSILGISSIAGYRGLPARTGYSASKFAMNGFLEALRTELLQSGVHVCTVAPGFTASNIRNTALDASGKAQGESPLNEKGIMSAEEVALHILRAVQKRKRSIVLTSQGKLTVFLNKLFPGWMDKKVFQHFAKEKDSPLSSH